MEFPAATKGKNSFLERESSRWDMAWVSLWPVKKSVDGCRPSGSTTPSFSWINICQMSTTRPRRRIYGWWYQTQRIWGLSPYTILYQEMTPRYGDYLATSYLIIYSFQAFFWMIIPNPWWVEFDAVVHRLSTFRWIAPALLWTRVSRTWRAPLVLRSSMFQEHGGLHWCSAHPC